MLHIQMLHVIWPAALDAIRKLAADDALALVGHPTVHVRVDDTTDILTGAELFDPSCLDDLVVLGLFDLRFASHTKIAAIPDFGDVEFVASAASAFGKRWHRRRLARAFRGLHVVRVERDRLPWKPADVIVAREPDVQDAAIEAGLAKPGALVLDRVRSTEDVADKHVIGEIEWAWAGKTQKVTPLTTGGILSLVGFPTKLQKELMGPIAQPAGENRLASYRVADVDPTEIA